MKNGTTQMILGMAVAAAAGAAIGMLLAPEKGTDSQKRVREGIRSLFDELRGLLSAGRPAADESTQEPKTDTRRIEA